MQINISEVWTLILAVLAIWSGIRIHHFLPRLQAWSIPPAITGGLLFAVILTVARHFFNLEIHFADLGRQTLLLIFFAGIGLSAKLHPLLKGGKSVAIICAIILLTIVIQNMIGIGIVHLFGMEKPLGLFFGSISYTGGHGTTAAWAQSTPAEALHGAFEAGMASATFGLIAGGLVAGPVAAFLIRHISKHQTYPLDNITDTPAEQRTEIKIAEILNSDRWLIITLIICTCLALGEMLRTWTATQGWVIPGFLAVLLTAIIITNLADITGHPVDLIVADLTGTIALRLFLAISMMGLKLWELADLILPLLVTLAIQIGAIITISALILYPLLGRGYQAAVACAGFIGCSLGAMPVGLGVMKRLTTTYGPAPHAILILTMAYALFTDTANAIIVNVCFMLLN